MNILLLLGITLGIGYFIGKVTHQLKITAVVGYLIIGILLGPHGIGLINPSDNVIHLVTVVTLGLIAFEIGVNISPKKINKIGKKIVGITFLECLITFLVTSIGMYLVINEFFVSVILGSLATATAPASRMAIIREYRAHGKLTDTVIAVVGIDDAFGVTFFTITLAMIKASMENVSFLRLGLNSVIKVIGPIFLGLSIGLVTAFLLKKFEGEEELFVGVLTSVLFCSGLAELFEIDWILANMALGLIFTIFSPDRAERAKDFLMNRVLAPVFVVFFVIVGVTMEIDLLLSAGLLAITYVITRSLGKIFGGNIGARVFNAPEIVKKYLGISLLSQAGVAVGLALTVSKELPGITSANAELGSLIVTIIAASTILFEFIGTISFRHVLTKTGEAGRK